ncbi:hypothetical protein HDZ31DRAFT_61231 [Schizophyllum fasciatum]
MSCLLFVLAASLLHFLTSAIYNLYRSPLRKVPGPWYAAISDLWFLTCLLRLRQSQIVHALFETYGPIVRIGPKRVAFNDVADVKSVYAIHRFDKTDFYKMALECGEEHAFCILESGPHAARRKTLAQHYTKNN